MSRIGDEKLPLDRGWVVAVMAIMAVALFGCVVAWGWWGVAMFFGSLVASLAVLGLAFIVIELRKGDRPLDPY